MPWLATVITDYQLYRRRLVLACIGLVCVLALFVDGVVGVAEGLPVERALLLGFDCLMVVYFVRMAFREVARMKNASR